MKFRTELDIYPSDRPLLITDKITTLGSCFSRAIGTRLEQSGADIAVNPLGVLFNPISIASMIVRALNGRPFTEADLYRDETGVSHLLALESRRQSADAESLLISLNKDFADFSNRLSESDCWIVTFGTAWCFHHLPTQSIVGNCHKLPDKEFKRHLCGIREITAVWSHILKSAPRVIFTVSPVRHLNDGLHGNTVSKARLHLAVEELCRNFDNAEYFPAYEALVDDLRDYRFYADDLKHPSDMAEEYIFNLFCQRYYDSEAMLHLRSGRNAYRQTLHRPIVQ